MAKSPEEVFSSCEDLHNQVAALYEAVVDDEKDVAKAVIEDLESKLVELKKEL